MKKSVTMTDIARKMGVSTVTVSKAFSGKPGVSDQLKEEIIKTAKDMGYSQPAKKRTVKNRYVIGVIVAKRYLNERRSFYWRVYRELSILSSHYKMLTVLEVIDRDTEEGDVFPNVMKQDKADGLIIMGPFKDEYIGFLSERSQIPILGLDTDYEKLIGDAVIGDNVSGGRIMTEYLLQKGHKRVGFVGSLLATPSIDSRYLGYVKAMLEYGIPIEEEWIIEDRDRESGIMYEADAFRLPEDNIPTAFFCNCDLAAVRFAKKVKKSGLAVPDDVSVVGFDNYLPEAEADDSITTFEIKIEDLSIQAMELLKRRIENPELPRQVVLVRGRMLIRKSAGHLTGKS